MKLSNHCLIGRYVFDRTDGYSGMGIGDNGIAAGEGGQGTDRIQCPGQVLQRQPAFRHDAFSRLRQSAAQFLQVLPALGHDTGACQQQALPGLLQYFAVLCETLAGVLLAQAVRQVIELLGKLLEQRERALLKTAPEQ